MNENHPVSQNGELTLAWARIDLDLKTNEALIEEIQSDWVRNAMAKATEEDGDSIKWSRYVDTILRPHSKVWDQAMLASIIWFLVEEIGVTQLFYHTFETGSKFKHITWDQPPKSLYTKLPSIYCFEITHNGPRFIRDTKDKHIRKNFVKPDTKWYFLDFSTLSKLGR